MQWCRDCAGIRVFCQEERSQLKNKARALSLLRAKLYELELEKQRSAISAQRKSQVWHVEKEVLLQLDICNQHHHVAP
jgi:protein subunit release factor A